MCPISENEKGISFHCSLYPYATCAIQEFEIVHGSKQSFALKEKAIKMRREGEGEKLNTFWET